MWTKYREYNLKKTGSSITRATGPPIYPTRYTKNPNLPTSLSDIEFQVKNQSILTGRPGPEAPSRTPRRRGPRRPVRLGGRSKGVFHTHARAQVEELFPWGRRVGTVTSEPPRGRRAVADSEAHKRLVP